LISLTNKINFILVKLGVDLWGERLYYIRVS
jgi:hypothetical protein